nr:hypothetical protein [Planotetraspora silvatica]
MARFTNIVQISAALPRWDSTCATVHPLANDRCDISSSGKSATSAFNRREEESSACNRPAQVP